MLKRFRQEKAVWVKYGAFLLRRGKAEASHHVMQRALECLPKKERECSFLPPTQILSPVGSLSLGRGVGVFSSKGCFREAFWRVRACSLLMIYS